MRIVVFGGSGEKEASIACAQRVADLLRRNGVEVNMAADFAPADARGADLAISVGGDGTFLKTAAAVRDGGVPIWGINTGRLGFLADTAPSQAEEAVERLLRGDYGVEERSLLSVRAEGAELATYPFALNEVAVLKYDNSSLINISTHIDGELLANYVADGLIVCTPTGSTGYSLSVNGPIVSPNSPSLCISAVAPHSLNVRPVVVSDSVEIALTPTSRTGKFLLAIDGRSQTLEAGTRLLLRRAPYTCRVVKVIHPSFFDTLRDKMMWGADQRFN